MWTIAMLMIGASVGYVLASLLTISSRMDEISDVRNNWEERYKHLQMRYDLLRREVEEQIAYDIERSEPELR